MRILLAERRSSAMARAQVMSHFAPGFQRYGRAFRIEPDEV